MTRAILVLSLTVTVSLSPACSSPELCLSSTAAPGSIARLLSPSPLSLTPSTHPGIHNAVAFHDGLVSGSAPAGDEGFDTLAAMGFKTIISVDGARPEVNRAEARGLWYVHLPIGYDGIDERRKRQLARAARDAMSRGPVYIHCHHGKHRSAAAAATISVSLGWASAPAMVERMKVSGTSPSYSGLWACAEGARELEAGIVDREPSGFPSVWTPSEIVDGMVEMDRVFERIRLIQHSNWKTPADHPDLVAGTEARRLADLFRVLAEEKSAGNHPIGWLPLMRDAHAQASALEDLLVAEPQDVPRIEAQFDQVARSCTDCHRRFRD